MTPGQSAVFYNGEVCLVAVLLSSVCRCRPDYFLYLKKEAVNVAKNYYDITLALAGIVSRHAWCNNSLTRGIVMPMPTRLTQQHYRYEPQLDAGGFGGSEANLRVGLETLLGVLNAAVARA